MGKRIFSKLLKDKEELVGAEIGVFRGDNAADLLELDVKKLYLVDPYKQYSKYEASAEIWEGLEEAKKEAVEKLDKKRVKWLFLRSVAAAKKVKDSSLDFVYIDGNHAEEFVKQDIECWSKKVKRGGLVGGHDYDERHGVIPAVTEFAKENDVEIETAGIEWWYWKK